jgi:hypothetical protein
VDPVTYQISDSYLAFMDFVRDNIISRFPVDGPNGHLVTVGEARSAWEAQYSAELTIMDMADPWVEITDTSKDDYEVCGMTDGWPGPDQCVEVDPDVGLPLRIGAKPTCVFPPLSASGPRPPLLPCPTGACVYQLDWDYEDGTDKDTSGTYGWADVVVSSSGLYNPGHSGTYFGLNQSTYDELAGSGTGTGHLPITAGQTVTLSLLFNNRSASQTSTYTIRWFTSINAVTNFASATILTAGGHGNSWQEYEGSAVAPTGANAFSILMDRQCGQDDVMVCVGDAA